MILERYHDLVNKRKDDTRTAEERKKEMEKQDALMAMRLLKSNLKTPVKRQRKVTKKPKERDPTKNQNNPFFQEQNLSEELESIIGLNKSSRPQVVKQLWAYIKDNNLQNPEDKRQINCDDKLQTLFKKSTLNFHRLQY